MTDGELVKLFFDRSERALEALEEKYGGLMRKLARNILRDERDAEECVSDARLALWNSIPPQKPENLMAYAARVTRNLSTKAYHRNTAQKRNSAYDAALDELAEVLPDENTPEAEALKTELAGLINRFLSEQSRENRVLFTRRYWFSDKVPDIAKRLGMTENGVYVRLSRLREKLRRYLEKEGYSL